MIFHLYRHFYTAHKMYEELKKNRNAKKQTYWESVYDRPDIIKKNNETRIRVESLMKMKNDFDQLNIKMHQMKKLNFDMEKKFEKGSLRQQMHDFIEGGGSKDVVIELLHEKIDQMKSTIKEIVHSELGHQFVFVVEEKKKYPKGILSFKSASGIWEFPFATDNRGYASYNDWVEFNIKEKHGIHSVKNSSNEVLTIGDETNFGKIKHFEIKSEKICTWFNIVTPEIVRGSFGKEIHDVHPKKKEFITTDGVKVPFGSTVYYINEIDWKVSELVIQEHYAYNDKGKYFDRRYNADEYITQNKPRFSKKQLKDALDALTNQGGDFYTLLQILK